MSKSLLPAPRDANHILARLPQEELSRLRLHLKAVPLKFKQVLCETNGRIDHAWFLKSGVLSAITVMRNGSAIEAANIGNGGLFGWTRRSLPVVKLPRPG